MLGKLGFEIYALMIRKRKNCSLGLIILSDTYLESIANIGIVIFSSWSYYYIFSNINSKNAVLFTILNAIFDIGVVLLFFNRHLFNKENVKVNNTKNKVNSEKQENKSKYCAYCGNKLNENSKYCSKCGRKFKMKGVYEK